MREETVLKNTFFGGYRKRDVIEHLDFVLEENEKRVKELEEQVAFLTKENKKLSTQLSRKEKNKSELLYSKKEIESVKTQVKEPIPFARPVANVMGKQEDLSIRQQMELPEGTYFISKENEVINLPEPQPIYQTKGNNHSLNWIDETEYGSMNQRIQEENTTTNQTMKEENETLYQRMKEENEALYQMMQKEDSIHFVQDEEVAQYIAITDEPIFQEQNILTSQKEYLTDEYIKLQKELQTTKKLLENEKNEKQKLSAKLEFSNDLLLQLYNNQSGK